MKILLTGGSANGKSTYAEFLAAQFPKPRYYVAAMQPYDDECLARIERHRALHSRKEFITLERYTDLEHFVLPERGTVLLECLCNLLDNEMFDENGQQRDAVPDILRGLDALEKQCDQLIIVTNDVGSGGSDYSADTLQYIEALGRLNIEAANRCDTVIEVVSGIPILRKGVMPPILAKERDKEMILVVGGEASGKRTYVKSLGFCDEDIADAVLDECPVLDNLEKMVANDYDNIEKLLPNLLDKKVVICNEVGSGVIPGEARERDVRVKTGRMCALLAQHADQVVRMVCGIPTILKG